MYSQGRNFSPFLNFLWKKLLLLFQKWWQVEVYLQLFQQVLTAKHLSAITEMPGISCSLVRNPETRVSSTSEMDPT